MLNGEESALIEEQTNLLNATEILLANNGLNAASFAHYWRDRSGTADQHTSFSVYSTRYYVQKIISMYAKGMTTRQISDTLEE